MAATDFTTERKAKFDPATIIYALLDYERYLRLMLLLLLVGLQAGVIYFVYSRATFTSTSLIKIYQYADATAVASGSNGNPYKMMSIVDQLNSGQYVLETLRSLNAAGDYGYLEAVEFVLPTSNVGIADDSHLSLSVAAFDPSLVREYPKALVDTYYRLRNALKNEYRQKAIDRYLADVAQVRNKVREELAARLKYEEESHIAQTQIELEQLSDVPVSLVRTRYRLGEYDRVRKLLDEQGSTLGVIGQLSLLTAVSSDKNDPLKTGKIVRSSSQSRAPVNFVNTSPVPVTEVVVQPDMVQGLQPWEKLEKEKRATEEELALARTKYGEQNEVIEKLQAKLREIAYGLDSELSVARKAFELESQRLKEQQTSLETRVKDYRDATRKYDEQKTDFDLLEKGQLAWDKAYQELSKQLGALQGGFSSNDAEMEFSGFTNMRDHDPVSPSKFKLAMLGSLLGLALALAVPFALQKLNMSVSSLSDCENASGTFTISVIPEAAQAVLEDINRAHPLNSSIPNPLLEGFRLIRSGVLIYGSTKGNQVVMVTSARPSEGKTTVCANLAWAFSSAGEKTVVIDCDLRRGRLHKVVGQASSPGLVEYLTGHAEIGQAIRKTPVDNLDVILRGALVPGASELLNSSRFAELLQILRSKYDRIVLDTPPVLGLSETPHLQRHADGAVVVTMADKTPRRDLMTACATLRRLGVHIYGCVLNRVDFTQRRNVYGYYYYSAQYYSEMADDGTEI